MLKTKDIIKMLEQNKFILIRTNKHLIYSNGLITVPIPRHRICSIGLSRRILTQSNLKHLINF